MGPPLASWQSKFSDTVRYCILALIYIETNIFLEMYIITLSKILNIEFWLKIEILLIFNRYYDIDFENKLNITEATKFLDELFIIFQ